MCASGRDICGVFGGVADLCRDSLHLRWSLPPFVSRDLSHRFPPLCSLLPSNHHALPSLTSSTRLYPRSLTCRQSDWYWPSCVYLLTISLRNAIIPDRSYRLWIETGTDTHTITKRSLSTTGSRFRLGWICTRVPTHISTGPITGKLDIECPTGGQLLNRLY